MNTKKTKALVKLFGNLQHELDLIRVTPEQWAAEFDSTSPTNPSGLLSLVHSNSQAGNALRRSELVKDRIKLVMERDDLAGALKWAIVTTLLSVKLDGATRWLERLENSGAIEENMKHQIRMAVAYQSNTISRKGSKAGNPMGLEWILFEDPSIDTSSSS